MKPSKKIKFKKNSQPVPKDQQIIGRTGAPILGNSKREKKLKNKTNARKKK